MVILFPWIDCRLLEGKIFLGLGNNYPTNIHTISLFQKQEVCNLCLKKKSYWASSPTHDTTEATAASVQVWTGVSPHVTNPNYSQPSQRAFNLLSSWVRSMGLPRKVQKSSINQESPPERREGTSRVTPRNLSRWCPVKSLLWNHPCLGRGPAPQVVRGVLWPSTTTQGGRSYGES